MPEPAAVCGGGAAHLEQWEKKKYSVENRLVDGMEWSTPARLNSRAFYFFNALLVYKKERGTGYQEPKGLHYFIRDRRPKWSRTVWPRAFYSLN
jgi:hypothetical protein